MSVGFVGVVFGSFVFREDSWEMRVEELLRRFFREDFVLRSGGVKSAFERWSEEGKRGYLCVRSLFLGFL